jgi:hypothetical protein
MKGKKGQGNCCNMKKRVGEGRRRGQMRGCSNKGDGKRQDKYMKGIK